MLSLVHLTVLPQILAYIPIGFSKHLKGRQLRVIGRLLATNDHLPAFVPAHTVDNLQPSGFYPALPWFEINCIYFAQQILSLTHGHLEYTVGKW